MDGLGWPGEFVISPGIIVRLRCGVLGFGKVHEWDILTGIDEVVAFGG